MLMLLSSLPDFSALFAKCHPLHFCASLQKMQKTSAPQSGWFHARTLPAGNKKESPSARSLSSALTSLFNQGASCVYESGEKLNFCAQKQKYGKEFPGSRTGSLLPYFCIFECKLLIINKKGKDYGKGS
ncbi:MAG: hypothetical protein IKD44_00535 [Lentisphaeria bacterium]|nr:hypothetical protein [Lentisphaeria bacterium]